MNEESPRCLRCGVSSPQIDSAGLCPQCAIESFRDPQASAKPSAAKAPRTEVVIDADIIPTAAFKGEQRFGDYEILGEIAHGGMGVVYKARQVSLNRIVAVKMIRADRLAREEDIRRFRTEAQAAAQLQHPNIVAIHEVGEVQGQHFYSMDFVAGQSLSQVAREKPLSPKQAARYVQQIAEAIHYAHQRGILHRDLKPSNVLIDENDEPRVADFGLAKLMAGDSEMTMSGMVMGSPSYMPPEQASGRSREVTVRSDVYSLGAILYDVLCGRPPFRAETTMETLRQVMEMEPVLPRVLNPRAPRDLETIVLKCLQKEPSKRYATAQDLSDELARFIRGEPIRGRPFSAPEKVWRWCRRKPAMAIAAALLLIVAIGSPIAAVLVNKARREAEGLVTRLEIEKAEQLFEKDDSATALAILARILRQDPNNRVVAERLLSAMGTRNYCLPALAPLAHGPPAAMRVSESLYSGLHAFRHSGSITFAQFSPNGERVLTAAKDRTARLWDSRTGSMLFELKHEAEVLCAQFSPDGQRIVTASLDQTAQTWNARTGQPDLPPLRHEGGVVFAEFSVTGEQVVTASEDYTARIWRTDTGEAIHVFKHTNTVYFARLTPDGHTLVAVTLRGQVAFWDTATGERSPRQIGHTSAGFATFGYPAFGSTGGELWTRDVEGNVRELSRQLSLKKLFDLKHDRVVNAASFSPDGLTLASASDDNTAIVWNLETHELLAGPLLHQHSVLHARFSPDGRRLATSSRDNTVRVWDARTGRPETEPLRHDSWVLFAEFSPDGRRLLTLPQGNSAWLWELRTDQPVTQPLRHANTVMEARFSPDGRRIATAADTAGARVWNAATFEPVTAPILTGSQFVEFSPDGTYLITSSERSSPRVWNATTGQQVGPPLRHDRNVSIVDSVQFSPDGQYVLTAGRDKTARIWTATSGVEQIRFVHDGEVRCARFSPDGQRVLTASYDSTAKVWDARNGTNLITLRHDDRVLLAEYNPDGSRVVTASLDATARIWDAETGRLLHTLRHDAELHDVYSVQFSPDGLRVVTVSRNAVQVWDARNGNAVTPALEHPGRVNAARFSPEGNRIVTACQDGVARILDAKSGHSVTESMQHDKAVSYAEFSPDGQWVVTASYDATARVWEVPSATGPVPRWLPELAEALAGQRLRDDAQKEQVPLEALWRLKQSFATTAGTARSDTYTRWAHWFFDGRPVRSITPSSQLIVSNYVMLQIRENTPASLEKAVSLAPDNALAQARLALVALTNEATPSPKQMAAADWRSARAAALAPHDPETLWARAEVCDRLGRLTEALEIMERAGRSNPTNGLFWHVWGLMLDRTNRVEEALQAYTRAIELSGPWQGRRRLPAMAWRSRAKLLQREGRLAEARAADLKARNTADRPAGTPPHLIDLTPYYTSGFGDLPTSRRDDYLTLDPRPLIEDGIEFDVRGIIHLNSTVYWEVNSPFSVRDIAIRQKCQWLYFLHIGCNGDTPIELLEGRTIAEYRMRYADGVEVPMPVIYGHHVRDEYPTTDSKPLQDSGSKVGWLGIRTGGQTNRLFRTAWNNPRPDVMIESLDFITHSNKVVPFLFAITAEP